MTVANAEHGYSSAQRQLHLCTVLPQPAMLLERDSLCSPLSVPFWEGETPRL